MKIINIKSKLLKTTFVAAAVSAFLLTGCGPQLLDDPDFIGQNEEVATTEDADPTNVVNIDIKDTGNVEQEQEGMAMPQQEDMAAMPQEAPAQGEGGCPAGGCPAAQAEGGCPSGNCDVPPESSNQTASRYDTRETLPTVVTKSHERQDAADHHNITHVHHRYQHHLHKRYVQQHKNFHTNEDTVVVDHPSSSSITIPYKTRSTSCSKTPVKHVKMPNKDYGCQGISYGCPAAGGCPAVAPY